MLLRWRRELLDRGTVSPSQPLAWVSVGCLSAGHIAYYFSPKSTVFQTALVFTKRPSTLSGTTQHWHSRLRRVSGVAHSEGDGPGASQPPLQHNWSECLGIRLGLCVLEEDHQVRFPSPPVSLSRREACAPAEASAPRLRSPCAPVNSVSSSLRRMCLRVDLGDLLRLLLPEALPTLVVWGLSLLLESSSGSYVTFSSLPPLPVFLESQGHTCCAAGLSCGPWPPGVPPFFLYDVSPPLLMDSAFATADSC